MTRAPDDPKRFNPGDFVRPRSFSSSTNMSYGIVIARDGCTRLEGQFVVYHIVLWNDGSIRRVLGFGLECVLTHEAEEPKESDD